MKSDNINSKSDKDLQTVAVDWRISKMGYKFNINETHWRLDGSVNINLGRIRELEKETCEGLKKTLCRYAEELSASTVSSLFTYFNNYCDYTGEKSINLTGISRWRASLTDETEYRLGSLKAFLIAWNEWGFHGVDKEVVEYLEEQTLKGITKGKAVKRACPYSGPLTKNELGALLDWVSNAFNRNEINLAQLAFFVSLVFTGRRSVQIRSLRAMDLIHREEASGNEYVIRVPRVKQIGGGFRKSFRSISVNEDLYLILKNQAEASIAEIERRLEKSLPVQLKREIPIFIQADRLKELESIEQLKEWLIDIPDYLHMSRTGSMEILREVSVLNMARSERTGEFINFTSRRFRYTKGTNLARRGISGVALAMALDHSDIQNIDVYTANTEEMAEHIDAIMTPFLAPLAQAFAGSLISSERDALRANDPHSRIRSENSRPIGNCGTYKFCASGYRACYTCTNFQAWRDAPHEEVLEEILGERNRQQELGVSSAVI